MASSGGRKRKWRDGGGGSSLRGPRVLVPAERLREPLSLPELTELLHYGALGRTAGVPQPSWCVLRRQRKVSRVNVVVVEGLTQKDFYKHYLVLPHLRTSYGTRLTFTPPSTGVASGIFGGEVLLRPAAPPADEASGPLQKALRCHPVICKYGMKRRGLTAYLLTQDEMIRKHYPVAGMPGFEDFLQTRSVDSVTDTSPLFGLDCEMVLTAQGMAAARVSLVDGEGKCVLDSLVRPEHRVIDYLTRFSGITAAMLRPVSVGLRELRAKLTALLPPDAVLVGHSINNDLLALKLIHPHVIDTSLLYRRDFGQRFKLKVLAEIVLRRLIQTEEQKGHNPVEDAQATLELAQYFITLGPLQVVRLHLADLWGYELEDEPPEGAPGPPASRSDAGLRTSCRRWAGPCPSWGGARTWTWT